MGEAVNTSCRSGMQQGISLPVEVGLVGRSLWWWALPGCEWWVGLVFFYFWIINTDVFS